MRGVTEPPPDLADAHGEGRRGHGDVRPDRLPEGVLGDETTGVGHQDLQDGERLRSEADLLDAAPHAGILRIEAEWTEANGPALRHGVLRERSEKSLTTLTTPRSGSRYGRGRHSAPYTTSDTQGKGVLPMASQEGGMKTTDGEGPPLPAARAFVVHLHGAAEPARSALIGRVEHIVSAESAHFDTLDELLRFNLLGRETHAHLAR